jgi:hypothetical protein
VPGEFPPGPFDVQVIILYGANIGVLEKYHRSAATRLPVSWPVKRPTTSLVADQPRAVGLEGQSTIPLHAT